TITINGKPSYELGSFLGGGAAGVVYEVGDEKLKSPAAVAVCKIVEPLLLFVCASTKNVQLL
ncbi:unnamed protein product, partial [Ectocarpus sp. 12 AP-2014]